MKTLAAADRCLFVLLLLFMLGCKSDNRPSQGETGSISNPNPADQIASSNGQKPRDVDYPDQGVELGQGWDSRVGQKTNSRCIEFAAVQDQAQDKTLDLKEVADKSSLMQQLDVSAEAQAKGIAGSASAKVHFVSSTKTDEEQSNFAVNARVLNGAKYAAPGSSGRIDLTSYYARMAHSDQGKFFMQCGDSFVSTIKGGAELSAILSFHIYQVDERKSLSTSVEGSGWGTFEASGSVSQTMNKYSSSSQLTIEYHEAGGSGDPIPTDQVGLVKVIHGLPALALSAPQYFTITLTRYDSLPSWPNKKSDWLYTQYEEIASQYEKFSSLHESVKAMLASPDDYILDRGVTLDKLRPIEVQLLAHMKSLKRKSEDCIDSSGANCAVDTADRVSDYEYRIQLPVRKLACPAYINLQQAIADAATKHKAYVDAVDYYRQMAENLRVNEKQKFWDAQTVNQRAADNQAAVQLQSLTAQFPDGLRNAISVQWIEIPARARCDISILDSGCIDEAAIQKLKQRIVIN